MSHPEFDTAGEPFCLHSSLLRGSRRTGLANANRSDKGKSRRLPEQAIQLVEGLALQTPPRSAAAIHRQVVAIALEQGWKPPSYERIRQIIKNLAPALLEPFRDAYQRG